ncbi:MAG: peptidase M48 [Cereibacter sphaeroides]|uniref:Peptidase M48 n=1 Tax=Cereibacter sphaeroides TaxID=1063 RepID=A0A2W5SH03_CERSP|nr:MAG: peptidase M48 [Cereibacter sphaeroides]
MGCAPGPVITPAQPALAPTGTPEAAAENFVAVASRVMPVAESICRERTRGVPCDYQIAIDDRPGQAPNAFQTLDEQGQPVLVFTLALIRDVQNPDELAFVMGHETAHHIAGHIQRQREEIMQGALIAGTLATLGGADANAVKEAQDMGAQIGARRYSKDYELEADALGTEIAWRAGFDPMLGAQFFTRLPDPGNRFLGSHPPNAQRLAVVAQTLATLQ